MKAVPHSKASFTSCEPFPHFHICLMLGYDMLSAEWVTWRTLDNSFPALHFWYTPLEYVYNGLHTEGGFRHLAARDTSFDKYLDTC